MFLLNPLLDLFDHLWGQVSESPLPHQVLPHRPELREVYGQSIPSPLYVIQGEHPCFYGRASSMDRQMRGYPPPCGADREDMNIGRPLNIGRFLHLLHQIQRITGTCRGHIGYVMSRSDLWHVLLPRSLPRNHFSCRRGSRSCTERSRGGTLYSRIHVTFIIKTYIDHIMPTFQGSGEGLKSDIAGPSVASHCHDVYLPFRKAPFSHQCLQPSLNPRCHGGRVLEGDMYPGNIPRSQGFRLHRRDKDNRIRSYSSRSS